MMRTMLLGVGLAVGAAGGCNEASSGGKTAAPPTGSVTDRMKDAAGKAGDTMKDMAGKTGDAMKDGAAKTKEAMKDAAEKGKEMSKEAADKLKKDVVEPVKDAMPKIEEKIKGLSGDAMTKAKAGYDALKKMVEDFAANPSTELGTKITNALAELKKSLGL